MLVQRTCQVSLGSKNCSFSFFRLQATQLDHHSLREKAGHQGAWLNRAERRNGVAV